MPASLERSVDLVFGDLPVQAGFRITHASELAGGPIELDFFAVVRGAGSRWLWVKGGRMQDRPADFSFAATFDGKPLADPHAKVPDLGGPSGVVEIAPGRPWVQRVVLNQFVELEAALAQLEPAASGRLAVACRRTLALADDEQSALAMVHSAPIVDVQFELELRRDDTRLARLARGLVGKVGHAPIAQRDCTLALLLSMRAPVAVEAWRALADHPDAAVAARVRQCLHSVGG